MNAQQRKQYGQLRRELDDLRQKDNHILFELGNPPEMDAERGAILERMRTVLGKMQSIERDEDEATQTK